MFEALARIRHRRLRRDLSAYLDEVLSPGARRRLEEHLDTCAACRRELAELRATRGALGHLPLAEVPRSFALATAPEPAVRRRPVGALVARPAVRRLEFGLRLATAAAAFALAVVVIGDFAGLPGGGGEEEAPAAVQPLQEERPGAMEFFSADEGERAIVAPTPGKEATPPATGYAEPPATGPREELMPEATPGPALSPESRAAELSTLEEGLATPEAIVAEGEGGPSREDVVRWVEIGLGAGVGVLVISWFFVLRHVRIRAQSQ